MLLAGEVKGELARIHPARSCCRMAELAGLLYGDRPASGGVRTFDHATARTVMHLAASIGVHAGAPPGALIGQPGTPRTRHHLQVRLEPGVARRWQWNEARCLRSTLIPAWRHARQRVALARPPRAARRVRLPPRPGCRRPPPAPGGVRRAGRSPAASRIGTSSTSRARRRWRPCCAWPAPTGRCSTSRLAGSAAMSATASIAC